MIHNTIKNIGKVLIQLHSHKRFDLYHFLMHHTQVKFTEDTLHMITDKEDIELMDHIKVFIHDLYAHLDIVVETRKQIKPLNKTIIQSFKTSSLWGMCANIFNGVTISDILFDESLCKK